MLHAIQLKSVLKWLLKPRGPNLVEAAMGAAPEKALVLAVTKHMLYEEDLPSMGVGLVYKPHDISTESFCIAYMHLNVWHAAASEEDSTDKLDSARFILVSISEWRKLVNHWLPFGFGVSGSILCGSGHLGRSLFIRPPFLTSKGMPPHPCWSMSQRSFLRACSRGPRWRYLSGLLPAGTGT